MKLLFYIYVSICMFRLKCKIHFLLGIGGGKSLRNTALNCLLLKILGSKSRKWNTQLEHFIYETQTRKKHNQETLRR